MPRTSPPKSSQPASKPGKIKNVTVIGDPGCDQSLYRGVRATPDAKDKRGLLMRASPGGSLLLAELITRCLAKRKDWTVQVGISDDYLELPKHYHAFSVWEPQLSNPLEKDAAKKRSIWRATEPLLGYGHPQPNAPSAIKRRRNLAPADILVLDDAGLDFRNEALAAPGREWTVLKLSGSIGEGALWNSLIKHKPSNLILIISADQLRRLDVRIGRGLSWEATVQDLQSELATNPALKPLLLARHLIVTFKSDAAFWLDNGPTAHRAMLVFDGWQAEGEWAADQGKGVVMGYQSSFTAAVVAGLCAGSGANFEAALVAGLSASRSLQSKGHGPIEVDEVQPDGATKRVPNLKPGFPFDEIASEIDKPAEKFVSTVLPATGSRTADWMMLDEWHVQSQGSSKRRPYFLAAYAAAILGPRALERFPVARFGGLLTVDRREIESLRLLKQAMLAYRNGGPQKKPLNVGVFGPPGAGKSFGVSEIARAVFGKDVPILTFNLSQFSDPGMLNGAFHQVRDVVIKGETPVVFWDEFDSESYKWLQYLLAPMNDGVFQDGTETHPIGKCVFIFAGATSPSFDTFGPADPDDPDHPDHAEFQKLTGEQRSLAASHWRDFVLKKGPDFKSRLVTHLDVLGPNPRLRYHLHAGERRWETDPTDVCFPIRRAFFIRSKFKLEDKDRLEIDSGVLQALLEVPRFKSGSRSLEFICDHLRQHTSRSYPRRSQLPGNPLLDRHLDTRAFWDICERDGRFLIEAEQLAQGFHEDWRKNPASKGNSLNKPWDELGEADRDSNIAQALRLPMNLAVIGLRIEKAPELTFDEEQKTQRLIEENIEILAEAEHNGWMVERMIAGWRYASIPKKDPDKKLHPLLLPYAQLPEAEKEKDRRPIQGFIPDPANGGSADEAVIGYLQRLKQVGYRVVVSATPAC